MQHTGRKLPHHDGTFIGLLQSSHCCAAADIPAVDEKVLHTPVGAAGGGGADVALHLHMAQLVVDRDQGGGKFPAIHCINGGGKLAVPWGVQLFLAVPDEPHGNLRMGQGQLIQDARHRVAFGGIFLQELHPGGGVVKQVPHQDGGALRAACLFQGGLFPAAAGIAHACNCPRRAGEQLHVGHSGDRGQCLSTEP